MKIATIDLASGTYWRRKPEPPFACGIRLIGIDMHLECRCIGDPDKDIFTDCRSVTLQPDIDDISVLKPVLPAVIGSHVDVVPCAYHTLFEIYRSCRSFHNGTRFGKELCTCNADGKRWRGHTPLTSLRLDAVNTEGAD